MQDERKVRNLVKRFDKMPSSDISFYDNEVPTKDTDIYQMDKDITVSKVVNAQGLDEISVTIDIGDNDKNYPNMNNISKSFLQPMNSGINKDSGFSSLVDHERQRESLFANEVNYSLTPVSQRIKSNENQYPKLSPWLSDKITNNFAEPQILTNVKSRSIGVDTFELDRIREEEVRLLKVKIDDLDCQIKIKDRELETNKWIEKEMQKHLQSTGDMLFAKNQVKELLRKLDVLERLNQDLTADNKQLSDDISKHDRTILELQSEVDNLDRVVANKRFIRENEENKRILEDMDSMKLELIEKEQHVNETEQRISFLQREFDKVNAELHFKNTKVDEGMLELTRCHADMAILDQKNYKILDSINAVERENNVIKRELLRFENFETKWQELEDENMYLKQSIQDLEDQYRVMEKRQDSSYQVNSLLDELRQALLEKNKANEERNQLFEQLRVKESIVKEKINEEKALLQDVGLFKKFIRELEEEISMYKKYEKEADLTEAMLRESERDKNALESQLVQLKPKIQKLQIKSLEKDHLITQLVQELKSQMGYLPSDLRKEISKNEIGYGVDIDQDDFLKQNDKSTNPYPENHDRNTSTL